MRLKNVVLLLFCSCCLMSQAQEPTDGYRPLVQEGKSWKVKEQDVIKDQVVERDEHNYRIQGDTLINGKTWKKAYYSNGTGQTAYYAAIREEGRKVYAIMEGSTRQRLIYDFNVKVGDILRCGMPSSQFHCILEPEEALDNWLGYPLETSMRLVGIDTVTAFGQEARRYVFTVHWQANEFLDGHVVWIEGVGSDGGPFMSWTIIPMQDLDFDIECRDGDGNMFGKTDFYIPSEDWDISAILYPPYTGERLPVPPYYIDEEDQYIYYTGSDENGMFMSDLVYTWGFEVEVGGKSYCVVYEIISAGNQERSGTIRMRRDGKRLLVRLDDYKQFMQKTRGQDMSGFEAECQYELTDDGEMVLYDFGMQPGDKFRSVEGKEDVCVTRIGKTEPRPDNGRSFNILYLSNGAYIIDQIGYAGCIDSNGREIVGMGDFFDYLGTGTRRLKMQTARRGAECLYGIDGGRLWGTGMRPAEGNNLHDGIEKIFSLSGREVGKPSAPGIYIQNGKKFVVK